MKIFIIFLFSPFYELESSADGKQKNTFEKYLLTIGKKNRSKMEMSDIIKTEHFCYTR